MEVANRTRRSADVGELLRVMARLRDPRHGCPWDVAQDFHSIAPYTVEEAYEVADAIARDDMDNLADELGDLLFQVVFHARMAQERGAFGFDQVVAGIVDKMVRRHPHVFGDTPADGAGAVSDRWEQIKAEERAERGERRESAVDGVPRGLSPLARAAKLQKRAARSGFDWSETRPVLEKLREEIDELEAELEPGRRSSRIREELGDVLFSVVNLARHLGVDAGESLTEANARFERRFRDMELAAGGAEPFAALDTHEKEAHWRSVK